MRLVFWYVYYLTLSELSREIVVCVASYVLDVLFHPEVVETNATLNGDIGRTEKHGTGDETTTPSVDATAAQEGEPVEVVETPEFGEHGSTRDTTLFCSSVQSSCVKECNLHPSSHGVAVSISGLILFPVPMASVSELRFVHPSFFAIVLEQSFVQLTELFLKVKLSRSLLPFAKFLCSPSVLFGSTIIS